MDNTEKDPARSPKELAEEIYRKHGVKVTDMSERGVRAIGIVGGVRLQKSKQRKQNAGNLSHRSS